MNALESTLAEFSRRLGETRTPYMVIGGFANLHWGRPRLTQDLDVTVAASDTHIELLLRVLAPAFRARVADPVGFARETSVVPMESSDGIRIDMVIARLSLEDEAIARAVEIPVGDARVRFATAEDLILHKIVSERARDLEDVEGIVRRQRGKLDLDYLRPRIRLLSETMQRPQMLTEFERLLGQVN